MIEHYLKIVKGSIQSIQSVMNFLNMDILKSKNLRSKQLNYNLNIMI